MKPLPPSHPRLRRPASGGFSLIEMLVVLSLIGIVTMLAAPSFNSAFLSNRLAGYANSFVASAQLARSEAIKRDRPVHVCASSDGASCAASGSWQQGWIVWSDNNSSGTLDTGEPIVQIQQAISADYQFNSTAGGYDLVFQPVGGGSSTATLKLCRATPSAGAQERQIKIDATGRPAVTTTTTGACP